MHKSRLSNQGVYFTVGCQLPAFCNEAVKKLLEKVLQ